MTAQDFDYVCRFVRDRSAIVLDAGKEYLVESRLGPLLQTLPMVERERRTRQERRQVCLLRQPLPWLLEFRQLADRRRRKRRHDDFAEHVDDQA